MGWPNAGPRICAIKVPLHVRTHGTGTFLISIIRSPFTTPDSSSPLALSPPAPSISYDATAKLPTHRPPRWE